MESWATSRTAAGAAYRELISAARATSAEQERNMMRHLALNDLWFLLVHVCGLKRMANHPNADWLFARTRMVQAEPDGYLDLWAREHYKSTIITFGLTIQNILQDPEITVGLFGNNRGVAKKFLRQIKREFEDNQRLKDLFPDILYENPQHQSPKWTDDQGLIVRRKGNPKEATIEGWGLVDGQPTGPHFGLMVYDDAVTEESVSTPEMRDKTQKGWELSRALGSEGGRTRYIGTRYHFGDLYKTIIDRGSAIPRIFVATDNGKPEGNPVLLSPAYHTEKRRDFGPYTYACQMLQNPVADEAQGFRLEWVEYWHPQLVSEDRPAWEDWNVYLTVDPAGEKKKTSDYSVFEVTALAPDRNYYTLTTVRDRMNLRERADMLIKLHRTYMPKATGYEKYGMQADIEYIKERQDQENYHFGIIALGGQMPKNDRIRRLVPYFEQHRWFIPMRTPYVDREKRSHDLTHEFIHDELLAFPVGTHDDMLDCKARILDPELGAVFPITRPEKSLLPEGLPYGRQNLNMARGHDYDPLEAI